MFNVITGREFEHTFDEIVDHLDSRGRLGSTRDEKDNTVQKFSQVWNYYSEAKDANEVRSFDRPDARTKIGKHARETCIACGLEYGHRYGPRFRQLCRADIRMSERNK